MILVIVNDALLVLYVILTWATKAGLDLNNHFALYFKQQIHRLNFSNNIDETVFRKH